MGQQAKWEDVDLRLVQSLLRNVVFGSQPGGLGEHLEQGLGERLEQSRKMFQHARRDCEKYLRTSILPQTVGRGLAFESGPGAKVEFRVSPEGFVQISITPPGAGEVVSEPVVVPEPEEHPFEGVEEPEPEVEEVEEPEVEEPEVEEVEEPEVEEPETKPKRNQTVPFIAELRERADALGVDISSFGKRRKDIFKHLEEVAASVGETTQLDLGTEASDEDIVVIGEESPVEVVDEEEEGPTVDVIVLDDPHVTPEVMEEGQTQMQEAVVDILEIEDLFVDEGEEDPPEKLSLQDKMLQASEKVNLDAECPEEDAYKDDGEEDEEDVVVYEPPPTDVGGNEDDGDEMYHEPASAFESVNFDDLLDDDDDE